MTDLARLQLGLAIVKHLANSRHSIHSKNYHYYFLLLLLPLLLLFSHNKVKIVSQEEFIKEPPR